MTDLSGFKELYDQGDKTQILRGLWWCVFFNRPIPPWLGEAFQKACRAKTEYKIKSWDDVFGRPFKKGIRPERERRNERIKYKIYKRVVELHNGGAGEPIDKKLFETVGKEFNVGGTVASELYYGIDDIDVAFEHLPERPKTRKLPGKIKKTRKLPRKLKNIREYYLSAKS